MILLYTTYVVDCFASQYVLLCGLYVYNQREMKMMVNIFQVIIIDTLIIKLSVEKNMLKSTSILIIFTDLKNINFCKN